MTPDALDNDANEMISVKDAWRLYHAGVAIAEEKGLAVTVTRLSEFDEAGRATYIIEGEPGDFLDTPVGQPHSFTLTLEDESLLPE